MELLLCLINLEQVLLHVLPRAHDGLHNVLNNNLATLLDGIEGLVDLGLELQIVLLDKLLDNLDLIDGLVKLALLKLQDICIVQHCLTHLAQPLVRAIPLRGHCCKASRQILIRHWAAHGSLRRDRHGARRRATHLG